MCGAEALRGKGEAAGTKIIGFLGGDARMARLAKMMEKDGYTVYSWGLSDAPGATRPSEAAGADRVVLPIPLEKDGRLNGTTLPLGELWPRLGTERPVYAGAVAEEARRQAETMGVQLIDYFADEALTVRNAVPTAEGALAAAMERLAVTLHGAPCLVLGFGRIGKLLAHDLAALGAQVSVSARRFDDFAWIDTLGYTPLHTGRLAGKLGAFRVIFNTVPYPVLDETLLREVRSDCVLIELASQPGIDAAAAQRLGLSYERAAGLPGKVAPETAAQAIKETLYRLWEEEEP